jgi:beta-RFAP synthase
MIEQPGLLLRFFPAGRLEACGPSAQRVVEFADRFARFHRLAAEPDCRIEVVQLPRQHVGLGVGTALAMSVASGLAAWLGMPRLSAEQLASSVGRGRRSAVGAHGFVYGGLVVEAGKNAGDELSPLLSRVELPANWRFVLITPQGEGLSGTSEEEAFGRLPPIVERTAAALREELMNRLLPAAQHADFDDFSESLYRFNRAAGECYAPYQSGPYASPRLAALVEEVRAAGVRGVGQSSWGPTLFALLPDQHSAERFIAAFRERWAAENVEPMITSVSRRGATIAWRELSSLSPLGRGPG